MSSASVRGRWDSPPPPIWLPQAKSGDVELEKEILFLFFAGEDYGYIGSPSLRRAISAPSPGMIAVARKTFEGGSHPRYSPVLRCPDWWW